MSGTITGGRKAAQTNKQRYGSNFYVVIGQAGGRTSVNGGFASKGLDANGLTGPERAALAGSKGGKIGGRISRRIKVGNQK